MEIWDSGAMFAAIHTVAQNASSNLEPQLYWVWFARNYLSKMRCHKSYRNWKKTRFVYKTNFEKADFHCKICAVKEKHREENNSLQMCHICKIEDGQINIQWKVRGLGHVSDSLCQIIKEKFRYGQNNWT